MSTPDFGLVATPLATVIHTSHRASAPDPFAPHLPVSGVFPVLAPILFSVILSPNCPLPPSGFQGTCSLTIKYDFCWPPWPSAASGPARGLQDCHAGAPADSRLGPPARPIFYYLFFSGSSITDNRSKPTDYWLLIMGRNRDKARQKRDRSGTNTEKK